MRRDRLERPTWANVVGLETASYIVGMPNRADCARLSDRALIDQVARLAEHERVATAALIASLTEFDRRRLYLPEGFPSLFAYCTERLRLSEHAAYHRIEAARAADRFPIIQELLETGALTLTAVGLLRPHLTEENHREVLAAAKHQGKRHIEELIARLHPQPDVRASVRKLPPPRAEAADASSVAPVEGRPVPIAAPPGVTPEKMPLLSPADGDESPDGGAVGGATAVPPMARRPAIVRALAPARYQMQITVSAETHAKLRRAQDLIRHLVPDGDPAIVIDRALTLLVQDLERKTFAAKKERTVRPPREGRTPRGPRTERKAAGQAPADARPKGAPPPSASRSRRIPPSVKREVWAREGGQCGFIGAAGRCQARGFLEFHHEVPFAVGGEATAANVCLRCSQHNGHEADLFFGPGTSRRRTPRAPTRSGPS
jgi:hypothetical protein